MVRVGRMNPETLGHSMFIRRCTLDDADPLEAAFEWQTNDGIRDFWTAEAQHVLNVIAEAT